MAHHAEPIDIDSDFDNKENSLHHNNVLPFTEKGYEELDVSELNMKLRYSITPASSPMSKSYTAHCVDNRSLELSDDTLNITINDNTNLTRSLNSNLAKNDTVVKSLKSLPLQAISSEQFGDSNRSTSVLRPLDTTVTQNNADDAATVSVTRDIDENSLLSSSSSVVPTPEATTPTKDNLKNDGGSSPIMRGIKTVLNMFRSSQSPIPPADSENIVKPDMLSPEEVAQSTSKAKSQDLLASTPISNHRKKEISPTKRNSPHKESIVFNEDLEKELQWKDETTIIFSHERIPIHKLFQLPQTEIKNANQDEALPTQEIQDDMNSTVEYMDISYNDSFRDRTMTDAHEKIDYTLTGDSDAEFLDCETTFTKNDSLPEDNNRTPVNDKTLDFDLTKELQSSNENTSGSRLKQIILNTTQDILDATLSITPEDLLPEALHRDQNKKGEDNSILDQIPATNDNIIIPNEIVFENTNEISKVSDETLENSITLHENLSALNQTVEIANLSVDKNQVSNVTATSENVISPILDQTIEITNSETNTEYKEELDATKLTNKILSETITFDSQHNIQENPDLTLSSEVLILNEKNMEDLRKPSTNHSGHDLLQQEITQDIEPSKTNLDTTNVSEHNSTNLVKTTNTTTYNPETLQKILNNSLLNPDDEGKSSPIREASITELASEVPLPDEDDLDKELNMPADQTDASPLPTSLPLDLVNNIKDQNEVTEMAHNLTLEKEKGIIQEGNNEDKNVMPDPNFERSDNIQDEMVVLDQERIKEIPDAIIEPPLSEEPQVSIVDVLPEAARLSNMDTNTVNTIYQMQDYVEVLNQTEADTECINTTVTHNSEETIRLSQTMDINESIVGLKPLPDIINQTNVVPNVGNVKSAEYVPEPIMVDQQENLPEDFNKKELEGNTVVSPETVPEAAHNVVPEVLSDKQANELTKVINNEPASAHDEITKDSATDGSAPIMNEDIPVTTDTVKDTQHNCVGIIPTEPVIQDNEKQTINTNVLISETADIKTVDDEIIVSENTSPFVSVTAEDVPGVQSEENIDVQNIDHRLVTDGKIVFTPPASPPIASKGYNFNFDEMDDPFATKTKIRISPPLDTSTKVVETKMSSKSAEKPVVKKEMINRRKSQPERKKPVASKRKFNSTYSGAVTDKAVGSPIEKSTVGDINLEPPPSVALELDNFTVEEKLIEEAKIIHELNDYVTKEAHKSEEELKPKDEVEQPVITSSAEVIVIETDESVIHLKDSKSTSSSEQSAYHTAGTSSNDSFHSRNVFNIPEIDDKNFNPFATKSKMRQSPPPPNLDTANPFATISKIRSSPDSSMIVPQNDGANAQDVTTTALPDDKLETELMEKDGLENLSNTTTSSKATDDKNGAIKEVNTEDEDTVEGPFLEADDKMLDFDGENIDMMQFHDLPTQVNDENGDNGELFIDAEAFEFLLNQNKNTVVDSGKESLFLKFDPLFAKRMSAITSESLGASLNKFQKRQSTPTKAAKPDEKVNSPVAGPSNLNITQDMDITHNSSEEFNEDLNITVSKPTMAVPPAVNPVTPRNKSLTPNRSNRRSLTFTSPAMAVIDRLLSLSGNTSLLQETAVTHATREQNETDLALTQLRELLAEKEITVYNLRSESKELKDRLSSLESHLKSLEDESQDRLKKINDLNDRLAEKTKINKSMAAVVEEYERTIASLISETAQDKKRHAEERIKLIKERDEQTAHLASMEVSFSDLHSKYEKSKQVILNCKANEDAYKKSIKEFEENITKMQNNYELLKQHATSKLNHANQELEKMNKTHEAEVLKLNAMIKRKDLHITSLEESLSQKMKANEELTAICDELINKVG